MAVETRERKSIYTDIFRNTIQRFGVRAYFVACVACVACVKRSAEILTCASVGQRVNSGSDVNELTIPQHASDDFFSLALRVGTDKVHKNDDPGGHHYHNAYQKYLFPLRQAKIKFLEIGLGCDMQYGPGKSALLWRELFVHPSTEIWEAEVNVACASKWNETMKNRILTGNQAEEATLRNWITTTGGEFDIIIDDGGHTYSQQLTSLRVLFESGLKAGGIYFMEDLVSNVLPGYNDFPDVPVDKISNWAKTLMLAERLSESEQTFLEIANLQSIECFRGMCAFHKCPQSRAGSQCP